MRETRGVAEVATDRAARYAKQLVSHLGRHHGGEWDEERGHGWIDLGGARATAIAQEHALVLTVEAQGEELERYEDVVGRHLLRFASADDLVVTWTHGDGPTAS